MAHSVKFIRRGVHGRVIGNFNMPGIIKSRLAVVHMSAGEVKPGPRQAEGGVVQDWIYHLGDANIYVMNVCPHFNDHFGGEPGGVEYVLSVDWHEPLDVMVTLTVEDEVPFFVLN